MAGKWLLRPPDPPRTWGDTFDRADEAPAVGWNQGLGLFQPRIVSGQLMRDAGGASTSPYLAGNNVYGSRLTFSNQFGRAYIATVSTVNDNAGSGPTVRQLDPVNYLGFSLTVNTFRSTVINLHNGNIVAVFEAATDGDVWELQVRGGPSATWFTVLRNWRVVGTAIEKISAVGQIAFTGWPGAYFSDAASAFSRWEGGELPGEMVPWFSRTPTYMPVLQKALRRMPLKRRQQFLRALILAVPQVGADLTQSGVSRLIRSQDDELVLLAIIKKFLEVNG